VGMAHIRLGSVVVGVDGSPGSDDAVEWAAGYAATTRRPLLVAHALGPRDLGERLRRSAGPNRQERRVVGRRVTDHALVVARRVAPELRVDVTTDFSEPPRMLVELSENASLLAVSTASADASAPHCTARIGQRRSGAGGSLETSPGKPTNYKGVLNRLSHSSRACPRPRTARSGNVATSTQGSVAGAGRRWSPGTPVRSCRPRTADAGRRGRAAGAPAVARGAPPWWRRNGRPHVTRRGRGVDFVWTRWACMPVLGGTWRRGRRRAE
jgi:nucleotide-binding universal stress UspA family protein